MYDACQDQGNVWFFQKRVKRWETIKRVASSVYKGTRGGRQIWCIRPSTWSNKCRSQLGFFPQPVTLFFWRWTQLPPIPITSHHRDRRLGIYAVLSKSDLLAREPTRDIGQRRGLRLEWRVLAPTAPLTTTAQPQEYLRHFSGQRITGRKKTAAVGRSGELNEMKVRSKLPYLPRYLPCVEHFPWFFLGEAEVS